VEHQEPLQGVTLVGQLADLVKSLVEELFTDGVVSSGVVVGGILLAGDHLGGVEKFAVFTSANLVDDGRLQIDKDGTRDILSVTSLIEEGGQSVGGLLAIFDGTVLTDAVLEAVKLPASSTELNTSLTNVKRDDFTHDELCVWKKKKGGRKRKKKKKRVGKKR